MKKKIVSIVLAILVLFSFSGCTTWLDKLWLGELKKYSAKEIILVRAGIEIPTGGEELYYIGYNSGFSPGRDFAYSVFQFENEPTVWLNENSFKEKDSQFEMYFSSGLSSDCVKEIPQDFLPNFEEDYRCMETDDSIYFVYNIENYRLIVLIPSY